MHQFVCLISPQQYSASSLSAVKRPSSISTCPLKTDDTIALVTEKVRKMDARFVKRKQQASLKMCLSFILV